MGKGKLTEERRILFSSYVLCIVNKLTLLLNIQTMK